MSRVQCISVIDESSPAASTTRQDWLTFRNNYPNREFWLLQPAGSSWTKANLNVPAEFDADPYAHYALVNRDNNVAGNRSDWFAICNLGSLPAGSIISVAIDTSGSMTLNTVRASYDYFLQRCAAAGIEIVLDTTYSDERWVPPHNKDIPPSANFTANPLTILRGESTTLSWIVFGDAVSVSIDQGVGSVGFTGSTTVFPTQTTTYVLTAVGTPGNGSTGRTVQVRVLIPPIVTLSLNPTSIISGQCSTLSWSTTGDANTIQWTSNNINNLNLTSSSTVCPTTTTTYSAKVSGDGGEDTDSITLIVYQTPTVSLTAPNQLNYGQQGTISYSSSYANVSINVTPAYQYSDGLVTGEVISLPVASSAESGATGTSVSGTFQTTIPYTTKGPRSVTYGIVASGNGGSVSQQATITILIDETPQNIIVPETEEVFKDQDPVITPDSTVVSTVLEISDIDIPVEIKADRPIQVDINDQESWQNLRRI